MRRVCEALIVGDFRKIVDCGDLGGVWMRRVRGALIVGKSVWDSGGVWMRWVIVGDFGRLWMGRVRVGIIETERCI